MTDKRIGVIDVGKAIMNVSFTVLAAIGGASGNIPLAALAAIPLAATQTVGPLLARSTSKQDQVLEIPLPSWWTESNAAWQGVCKEIEDHLPDILRNMTRRLERTNGVTTDQVVRQTLIDAVTDEPLVWEWNPEARKKIAEYIATPLMQKMSEMLKAIVDPLRQQTMLVDIHDTAGSTAETVAVLERIYDELRIQRGQETSLSNKVPLPSPQDTPPEPIAPVSVQKITDTTPTPRVTNDRSDFDVFLCYNSADRNAVEQIAQQLEQHGIRPWFDKWELIPGRPFQTAIESQIKSMKVAAVFVSHAGMGPWHQLEMQAALRQFIKHNCPVIPVLLPGATQKPELPAFLEGMEWVDFNEQDSQPLEQLIWGITGQRT